MTLFRRIEEYLRVLLRNAIPAKHYMRIAQVYTDIVAIRHLGLRQFELLRQCQHAIPGSSIPSVTIVTAKLRYPFEVRVGTSDAGEFCHTVIRGAYDIATNVKNVRMIVDAGANIGDSACWYASKFPSATIIALEPEIANFRALQRNARPYGSQITAVHAALWHLDCPLKIIDGDSSAGTRVAELQHGQDPGCSGLSPDNLIQRFGLQEIDIFKMDIEGEEEMLLQPGHDGWIGRTSTLIVDIHSARALARFLEASQRWKRSWRRYRELYVLHPSSVA